MRCGITGFRQLTSCTWRDSWRLAQESVRPMRTKRISEVIADARETEDVSRRATAHVLLWLFLALLMGAFSASYAATIGGRQRDHVKAL
jgi:hypothetical protein